MANVEELQQEQGLFRDRVFVSIDLETTGLNPESDRIIEIGAVKFQGAVVLDTFSTLVNPDREISAFIQDLTGISNEQLGEAPSIDEVKSAFIQFVGGLPIVGHNISFDVACLHHEGIDFTGSNFDTWELAIIALPRMVSYSLSSLCSELQIHNDSPHRAKEDAEATAKLFDYLVGEWIRLPLTLRQSMHQVSLNTRWSLREFLDEIVQYPDGSGVSVSDPQETKELGTKRMSDPVTARVLSLDTVSSLFAFDGAIQEVLPGYEFREQQVRMVERVSEALRDKSNLLFEAGTGVGKSLGYLMPAAIFSRHFEELVVVSTNTIALQEQLIAKDLPIASLISSVDHAFDSVKLQFSEMKGRANYLCRRRFREFVGSDGLTVRDLRFALKVMVWLSSTKTGDREEIQLTNPDQRLWERVCARSGDDCYNREGECFFRQARARAADSDILVVNHALLLANAQAGGSLLPEYKYLVIDEAHHLESEATRQFGARVSHRETFANLDRYLDAHGAFARITVLALSQAGSLLRNTLSPDLVTSARDSLDLVRASLASWFVLLAEVLRENFLPEKPQPSEAIRIDEQMRGFSGWERLEQQLQDVQVKSTAAVARIRDLDDKLDAAVDAGTIAATPWISDLGICLQEVQDLFLFLNEFVSHPRSDGVYWVTMDASGVDVAVLDSAPLQVSGMLQDKLYHEMESIVMTGATLAIQGEFDSIRERLGIHDVTEIIEESPFDYKNNVLLVLPSDMPPVGASEYERTLADSVMRLAETASGRCLVLFTSYSSMRGVHRLVAKRLNAIGVEVFAQGIDGSAQRVVTSFKNAGKAVLMGTNSLWEGVDIPGIQLQLVIIARLPFDVPTDPIVAARSQLFGNPFMDFSVPNAVIRFRQGFGRLIRTAEDFGAVIVLDERISSRGYGRKFIESLPNCTRVSPRLEELDIDVRAWLSGKWKHGFDLDV